MIQFEKVSFTYPNADRSALADVTLELPEGELILVMGPSGSGKSTLLRCINGLVPHFSGGQLSGNIRVNSLNPLQAAPQGMSHHVGFVFQDPEAQFVMDRVEDEIAFALENAAIPPAEMRVRVEETLDLLDLTPLRDRALSTLSGGERQRVAIAAVLALRPKILALDEPTSQLDPKSAEDVLNSLVRLNSDLGLTVLLAEHRLERVLPYVDEILYLYAGDKPPWLGDPREVLAEIELVPPLVRLGKELGWQPLPLTIKEGLRFSRKYHIEADRLNGVQANGSGKSKSQQAMPFIQAKNVVAGYAGEDVLRGVNLNVACGEIVVVMGRNGSGKTTLLKTLVGLVQPTRGEVRVDGQSIAGQDTADICRTVAYLPQDPNSLLFADTVAEELEITLRNHGLDEAHNGNGKGSGSTALLDRLGISQYADSYPRDLSAGERQRVALAAVTVTQPSALLLDEPTRGLDYVAKRGLVELLKGWCAEGMAIAVVTHDVELAAELADRVVMLSQGEVIAEGEPSDVMGTSPLFAPQVAKLFPHSGWLTVEEALAGQEANQLAEDIDA